MCLLAWKYQLLVFTSWLSRSRFTLLHLLPFPQPSLGWRGAVGPKAHSLTPGSPGESSGGGLGSRWGRKNQEQGRETLDEGSNSLGDDATWGI